MVSVNCKSALPERESEGFALFEGKATTSRCAPLHTDKEGVLPEGGHALLITVSLHTAGVGSLPFTA